MEGKQILALGGNPDKEAGYSHGLKVYPQTAHQMQVATLDKSGIHLD